MYIPPRQLTWLGLIFTWRGSVLARVWPRIAIVTCIALVNTAVRERTGYFNLSLTPTPFGLIGLPLGIFLGFRNGASYDRFWEGRRLWGALTNASRTLTRQWMTLTSAPPEVEFSREMVYRLVAYAARLRGQLREEPDDGAALRFLPETEQALDLSAAAQLHRMGERLAVAWRAGWVDVHHVELFDAGLRELCDVQGGCERIKTTPIPFSYSVLIHRIVALYCFLLPFGCVETIHWLTPLVVLFISYAFFGLDQIGVELEDPFGHDVNDLPLGAMTRNLEIELRTRLGDSDLPKPLVPDDGVLR